MSRVKIEGNASGTGTFTIAAPNSNTDRTFNLPDEAGTVLTSASAASSIPGYGNLTDWDVWRLTGASAAVSSAETDLTVSMERTDTDGFEKKGDGMSVSSGIFTFPRTGYWLITHNGVFYESGGGINEIWSQIVTSSSYPSGWSNAAISIANIGSIAGNPRTNTECKCIFKVTDTALNKCKFSYYVNGSGVYLEGNTNDNRYSMTFIRLGDV